MTGHSTPLLPVVGLVLVSLTLSCAPTPTAPVPTEAVSASPSEALFLAASASSFHVQDSASGPDDSGPEAIETVSSDGSVRRATLFAVGDIMVHATQLDHALDARAGRYDFSDYFSLLAPIFASGDMVFGNLETPIAGEDRGGFTGYPAFNAPDELLDALAEAHFTVLSTANNHALDRGRVGVERTLEKIRARGMVPVGSAASPEEAEQIVTIERHGVTLAFLAYTYGLNGGPLPMGRRYLVQTMDEQRIVADIARAREMADAVVLSLHWGEEYAREPSTRQRRLARRLVEAGADVIIGHHPHVVQPYEWIEVDTALGQRRGLVSYSLGNIVSNQTSAYRPYTEFGAFLEITFEASADDPIQIASAKTHPTWVHRPWGARRRHYYVLPLEATLSFGEGPYLTGSHLRKMRQYLAEMQEHLDSFQPGNPPRQKLEDPTK
jgi:poly-gamma-glutamate capsule biosynthesis protein CapA/YwtB (metallophosphatase superfamily)